MQGLGIDDSIVNSHDIQIPKFVYDAPASWLDDDYGSEDENDAFSQFVWEDSPS